MTKEQIDELAKDYAAEWWRRYEDRLVYRPYQWILRLIAKSMVKAYKKGFNEAKRFYKKRKSYVIMDMDLAGYLATRKKIDGLVTKAYTIGELIEMLPEAICESKDDDYHYFFEYRDRLFNMEGFL